MFLPLPNKFDFALRGSSAQDLGLVFTARRGPCAFRIIGTVVCGSDFVLGRPGQRCYVVDLRRVQAGLQSSGCEASRERVGRGRTYRGRLRGPSPFGWLLIDVPKTAR